MWNCRLYRQKRRNKFFNRWIRGYDSVGIGFLKDNQIHLKKSINKVENLENLIKKDYNFSNIGIGHTRWATHGKPSMENSHPHKSFNGNFAVVHNGIIENYCYLKEWLKQEGYTFSSDTDSEVIPNLIDYFYKGDFVESVIKAIEKLKGSYALCIIYKNEPNKIIAVKKDSPLIIGLGEEENFIASDSQAILNYTKEAYLLNDDEFALVEPNKVKIFDKDRNTIKKETFKITWDSNSAEKNGFESFMLKEIHEQGKAIENTLFNVNFENGINFKNFKISKDELNKIDKIYIIACGTSYNAGLIGKFLIEKLAKIHVEVDISSEFRYKDSLVTKNSMIITLSQSGETADTLAVLKNCKTVGTKTIAITNVLGSSISREADEVIYTVAGPEIAVASTKAYVTQVVILTTLAMYFANLNSTLDKNLKNILKNDLLKLNEYVNQILQNKEDIKKISEFIKNEKSLFYIGRGLDYASAIEGSLKLKEISYIHSEAYAAGELKHGTLALIEKGTKVICILSQSSLKDKTMSNILEIKARGAEIICIANENEYIDNSIFSIVTKIPKVSELLSPILVAVKLQLIAYYTARKRDCEIDKPRNLAKSVTVE